MELKKGTLVYDWFNREVGHIERAVINPVTKQITYIVVSTTSSLEAGAVIPVDCIESVTKGRTRLCYSASNLEKLPKFVEFEYVPVKTQKMAEHFKSAENDPFFVYWNPCADEGSPLSYNWLFWCEPSIFKSEPERTPIEIKWI